MDKLWYILSMEFYTDEDLPQPNIFKGWVLGSEIYKLAFCEEDSITNCYFDMTIKGNHIPLWDGHEITLV